LSIAGLRLLILEDEPILGLDLEDIIAEAGGTSIYAERVEEALDVIAAEALDAAILDVNVHGRTSYPVADVLERLGLPFIFATGYGDALHPETFARVPTVIKPYALADLERALKKGLLARKSNRSLEA
jgi:DNA-binding NtrC family response regulator